MPKDKASASHYAAARRLLESARQHEDDANWSDAQVAEYLAREAQVEATLYIGEQLEVLAGLFATAEDGHRGPGALTREQYGIQEKA